MTSLWTFLLFYIFEKIQRFLKVFDEVHELTKNEHERSQMLNKTIVEIDLNAIKDNLIALKKNAGSDKKLLFAVKADGYGHGAVQVSKIVEEMKLADILGVSSPTEGIELRQAGITLPILVLGLILPNKEIIETLFDFNLSQSVADPKLAQEISKIAIRRKKDISLHLKVDTGMGRIGCRPEESVPMAEDISGLAHIRLEGIFSHFPVSDNPDSDFTREQIGTFKKITDELIHKDISIPLKHLANSSAILNYSDSLFTMVRPGIMGYGYMPSDTFKNDIKLIPSMSLRSYIVFIKRVKKGTALSYGLTYTTDRDSNIATIPVGYGDGYSRFLSNKGKVIIRNKTYPVVGRVCMDQILINLEDDRYALGEEVTLFGREKITAETIADWIGTIPYEVTCSISKRVPRVYLYPD